MVRKLKLSSWL